MFFVVHGPKWGFLSEVWWCILEKDCNLEQQTLVRNYTQVNRVQLPSFHVWSGNETTFIFSCIFCELWAYEICRVYSPLLTSNSALVSNSGWSGVETAPAPDAVWRITLLCVCGVLKRILHMLTYCCTKSNKLSMIIESLPAAKKHRLFTAITAGCLPL